MKSNKYSNPLVSGFTLLEIMIALGLLSLITLGIMNMNKLMFSGQASAEVKLEELEIRRIIATTFLDTNACENTLEGKFIGNEISQIYSSNGGVLFEINKSYGNNSLLISKMELVEIANLGNNAKDVNLQLTFKKMKKLAAGPNTKVVNIRLRVLLSTQNGSIKSCFVDSTSVIESMCEKSFGGTWDPDTNTCVSFPYVALSGGQKAVMTGPLTGTSAIFPSGISTGSITAGAITTDTIKSVNVTFTGNSTTTGTSYAQSFQYTSDRSLKENIMTLKNAHEKILNLRGVNFVWKKNKLQDVGFIAQEVKSQIPEVVNFDSARKIHTVDYAKIVPFLVEAMKEQSKIINDQQKQIDEMNKKIKKWESKK